MPDFNGELERHTEVAVNPGLDFRTEPSLFRASDPDAGLAEQHKNLLIRIPAPIKAGITRLSTQRIGMRPTPERTPSTRHLPTN